MCSTAFGTRILTLLLVLSLTLPLADARVQPTSGFNMFSGQEEVQAGQQASADISKQLPVLPDSSPVTQYIQRLGAQLAAHAPGEKWPYNFHVVNQKEINAFALPGGPIYVNLGTIQAADTEAQLAGVLAHEISHVVQRHGTRAASKQMAAQLPLAILGGMMGGSILGRMASMGLSFGVGSYFLKNSRQSEKEADLLGTDIMYDTGYNPRAMAQFFAKIQAQGGSNTLQFLSDHPDPGNRAQYVSQEAATLPAKKYRIDSPEFAQIKQLVAGMKPLTAEQIAAGQKQAAAAPTTGPASDVTPSSSFQTLDHADYTLSYPQNWKVFGDQSSAITIAPPSGVMQNAVSYGAMVSPYQPENPNTRLDQATHELLNSIRQSNPDIRQIGDDENIRVNGIAGKSVDLMGKSPLQDAAGNALRERDWLVTIQRKDGSLLYFVFIATDKDFGTLRPTFEQMLKSMKLK